MLHLERGSRADLDALASCHYRQAPAAAPVQIWRVIDTRHPRRPAAVLALSNPPLASRARDEAFGGRYRGLPWAIQAKLVNREIRTISRVIVAPPYRGLRLARRLVIHALRLAPTPFVEAFAALGRVHPFFREAGMSEHRLAPHPEDERLRTALVESGVDVRRLASARLLERTLADLRPADRDRLMGAIHRWANRRLAPQRRDPRKVIAAMRRRLLSPPVYYLARQVNARGGNRQTTLRCQSIPLRDVSRRLGRIVQPGGHVFTDAPPATEGLTSPNFSIGQTMRPFRDNSRFLPHFEDIAGAAGGG